MPTSTNLSLRYPSLSDAPNIPQDVQNLASDVDTKLGGVVLCTSSTRPTAREGAVIYETDTDLLLKYTGSAWERLASSRISFTPTLTATTTNPTPGTAAVRQGYYTISPGPMCTFHFYFQFGTSGNAPGSGQYLVTLPFTANSTPVSSGVLAIGTAMARDDSAGAIRMGSSYVPSSNLAVVAFFVDAATVGNAAPWTWSANDYLSASITYPI